MLDKQPFIIRQGTSTREALRAINDSTRQNMVLFVLDASDRVIGSVTDGDIRRGLLGSLSIEDPVEQYMNTKFFRLENDKPDPDFFRNAKNREITYMPVLDEAGRLKEVLDVRRTRAILPLQALMMAGGEGQRLRPLTEHVPKPMLPVGGKPIIVRNIERLAGFGIRNITVSVKYLGQVIEQGVGSQVMGAEVKYVYEKDALGTAGALAFLQPMPDRDILMMNSDLLTNIDFEDFYMSYKASGADMAVATVPYHLDVPYGVLETDDTHSVTAIREKPRYSFATNAGIYLLSNKVAAGVKKDQRTDATQLMEEVIAAGGKVHTYTIVGYWLDIGRHEDYAKAQADVQHISF